MSNRARKLGSAVVFLVSFCSAVGIAAASAGGLLAAPHAREGPDGSPAAAGAAAAAVGSGAAGGGGRRDRQDESTQLEGMLHWCAALRTLCHVQVSGVSSCRSTQ